jgi:prepilin-type processing-associated H-X9-DG protein
MNVRDPARGVNRSPNGFGGPPSHHGANFAMADGSVRFISEKVSPSVMRALATPNAGDKADESVLQAAR